MAYINEPFDSTLNTSSTGLAPKNVCKQCGKFYSYARNLDRHLKLECGKLPRFCCSYCPYRSKHKSDTIKHVVRIHNGAKIDYFFDDKWFRSLNSFNFFLVVLINRRTVWTNWKSVEYNVFIISILFIISPCCAWIEYQSILNKILIVKFLNKYSRIWLNQFMWKLWGKIQRS